MPLIYECIRIDISKYPYTRRSLATQKSIILPLDTLVARLSASPSVRAFVRQIRVFKRGVAHPDALDLLLSWIPEFSQLISFTWDDVCQIPITVLNTFGQHWPGAHLHLRTTFPLGKISTDWQVFKQAPNMLRSLQIHMPHVAADPYGSINLEAKRKLFWVLNSCPGLQYLSTYNVLDSYKDGPTGSWHEVKFGGPLPQLSELSITDRTFSVSDLLQWGRKDGWKHLKKITLWESGLLSGLRGCERSLRSIRLIGAKEGYESDLAEICSRTWRLTELKINTHRSGFPISTLAICGASLVTLAVLVNRPTGHPTQVQNASLDFLKVIQRNCPLLVNLALDIYLASMVSPQASRCSNMILTRWNQTTSLN